MFSKTIARKRRSRYMRIFIEESVRTSSSVIDVKCAALAAERGRPTFVPDLRVLDGLGYISAQWVSGRRPDSFRITPKGFAFFELQALARRDFWLKSILVPIVLAIITSLVTVYILPPLGERARLWLSGIRQPISQSQTVHAPTSAPAGTIQMGPTLPIPASTPAPSAAP